MTMNNTQVDEKRPIEMVEDVDNKREFSVMDAEKGQPTEELDRFGAHKKTDPVEIALVRKLDIYIMVSFSPTTPCNLLK